MIWWIWLIVAVILLAGELMTEGFFLFWFALGALGAAITALITKSLPLQLLIFILLSGCLLFFSRQIVEKLSRGKSDLQTNVQALVGKTGIITKAVSPHEKGLIKINGEEWSCVSQNNTVLPEGALAQVESLQGVTLTVSPAPERKVG
ncbi:MAG: NfeD family protein [Eubacteriales bacterium]|nr:NfeD family protein [Eubacteriales bacterium]